MPTSGSANYKNTRKEIITGALRTIGVLGQGATPSPYALSEANISLNQTIKELSIVHGMPLWKIRTCSPITMIASQRSYTIGLDDGTDIQQAAPIKILDAWLRSTLNTDQPVNLISKSLYDQMGSKFSTGTPNQMYYQTPGAIQGTQEEGTIWLYLTPDSTAATEYTLLFTGHYPFEDADADNDILDFPAYWSKAIRYVLADDLAYEYGLGITERAQIGKKAEKHLQAAAEGSPEEGSLFIQPRTQLG